MSAGFKKYNNMKYIPILMSTPMVQSILAGRKTMTRRTIKSRHESGLLQVSRRKIDGQVASIESLDWGERNCEKDIICPYGQPGDVLWVRETFQQWNYPTKPPFKYVYKADGFVKRYGAWERDVKGKMHDTERIEKWQPSLFMPKAACRIFLEVTNIRVERLQDISESDAVSEGIQPTEWGYVNYLIDGFYYNAKNKAKESFRTLWQSINGKESWDKNPFVWVVEFKQIEKPINF